MEGVMPKGWVVEAITRQAGSTLIMHERYAVAIADSYAARAAVEQRAKGIFDVRIETRDPLSRREVRALGLAPGEVRRR
jgi:hypothetical protein